MKPFLAYYAARFDAHTTEKIYRVYVTDSLRGIPNNTYKVNRWIDIVDPQPEEPERSGDEIVASVIENAGLTVRWD